MVVSQRVDAVLICAKAAAAAAAVACHGAAAAAAAAAALNAALDSLALLHIKITTSAPSCS